MCVCTRVSASPLTNNAMQKKKEELDTVYNFTELSEF